jgi:RNase H-fold protein (predicted Holliday junction resolvase)
MSKATETIIGISLGTQTVGIAAVKANTELVDWKTYTFKGAWSEKKREQIVTRLKRELVRFQPKTVGLKVPHSPYTSKQLTELHAATLAALDKLHIPVQTYTVADLKAKCLIPIKENKHRIATHLFNAYPELERTYKLFNANHSKHHARSFEAVCAALLAS